MTPETQKEVIVDGSMQLGEIKVRNRSRAQNLAKLIYGPTARVWVGRKFTVQVLRRESDEQGWEHSEREVVGVQVGKESGAEHQVFHQGRDLSEALEVAVRTYIEAGQDAHQVAERILAVQRYADVSAEYQRSAVGKFLPRVLPQIESSGGLAPRALHP